MKMKWKEGERRYGEREIEVGQEDCKEEGKEEKD